ncbi:hypothetical protein B0T14DRAFT_542947 [Immersiella caudata]|uniref:Uncharacterized protein n=1 Tax=Immersiella caudata TaxID=314043 RepID=A0AA39X1Z0_9PEZI|nr:hypothetical protein B0T14DRAFT_542947 [Immersiella caudata]
MAVLDFPGEVLPLDKDQQAKLRKFLHPAQILLASLNDICPRGPPRKPSDAPPNPNQSLEEKFHTFVNKLAQICDFEPKGDTITAMAIIMHDGKVTYLLASNRRGQGALNNARKGLGQVLGILKANLEAPASLKESDEVVGRKLMERILWWNKVRVRSYLTALVGELKKCMERCDVSTPEGQAAMAGLDGMRKTLPDLGLGGQKTEIYIEATIQCIKAIHANRRSPLQRYIDARAAEDHTMVKGGSWSNLQHAAGRLLSYEYAVQTLIEAHHTWANTDLFRDYEIESIRSSKPYENVKDLLLPTPETAEAIINRAPGYGRERLEQLKQDAVDLNTKYQLNNRLKERWHLKAINPIVHAEILLHSYLDCTPGGIQPPRFFSNIQYIGTSKPICWMCEQHFSIISTPVKFRSGHPNTYLNWRLPDLYVDVRPIGTRKDREQMAREGWCRDLGEMKRRVYAAVVRLLQEKVSEWKKFDSNTYTDRIRNGKTGDEKRAFESGTRSADPRMDDNLTLRW